jgi:hypothetical protein
VELVIGVPHLHLELVCAYNGAGAYPTPSDRWVDHRGAIAGISLCDAPKLVLELVEDIEAVHDCMHVVQMADVVISLRRRMSRKSRGWVSRNSFTCR